MRLLILFILLISVAYCAISNQLLDAMKEQAQKIASTMPKEYASLVDNIKADGLDGYDQCAVADYDQMMSKYNFTSQIKAQFQMITISEEIEFQAFQVSIKNTYNDIQEFIGAGLNYQGMIKIAFLQMFAEGTPVQQYEPYRCCHSCWLVGSCCNTCHREIGMTSEQLDTITEALRATAYEQITNFLNNPPEQFANYTQEQQQLEDQNKWDVEMSQYSKCKWEKEKDCPKSYIQGVELTIQSDNNYKFSFEGYAKSLNQIKTQNSNVFQIHLKLPHHPSCFPAIYAFVKHISFIVFIYLYYRNKTDYVQTQKFCFDNYFSSIQTNSLSNS